jgi:hypothetical protein
VTTSARKNESWIAGTPLLLAGREETSRGWGEVTYHPRRVRKDSFIENGRHNKGLRINPSGMMACSAGHWRLVRPLVLKP